jgi:hypothetical protein
MSEDGAFRTDNLAMAVVLSMAGFEYTLQKITARKAIWVFEHPGDKEEEFDDLIGDFDEFACKVEPRAFVLRHAEMRNEIFKLLPKPRHQVAPSSAT